MYSSYCALWFFVISKVNRWVCTRVIILRLLLPKPVGLGTEYVLFLKMKFGSGWVYSSYCALWFFVISKVNRWVCTRVIILRLLLPKPVGLGTEYVLFLKMKFGSGWVYSSYCALWFFVISKVNRWVCTRVIILRLLLPKPVGLGTRYSLFIKSEVCGLLDVPRR